MDLTLHRQTQRPSRRMRLRSVRGAEVRHAIPGAVVPVAALCGAAALSAALLLALSDLVERLG
jgi:hypothetical protein